jgi:hypothetical protein
MEEGTMTDRTEDDARQVEHALDPHVALKIDGKWYKVREPDYHAFMPSLVRKADVVVEASGKVRKNRHGSVGTYIVQFVDDVLHQEGRSPHEGRRIYDLPTLDVTLSP